MTKGKPLPPANNLGALQGPLAIFGGPYSNLQATETLKDHLSKTFAPNQIICTGDIVAYCANPKETTDLIKDWGIHCIQGNVEAQLSSDSESCGCNFVDGSLCETLSDGWFNFAKEELPRSLKDWMGKLPVHLTFEFSGLKFRVIHGGLFETSKFVFKSTPLEQKLSELDAAGCDVILSGHSGIPFSDSLGKRKAWINAGVIGMPPNDGDARLWYLTIEKLGEQVVFKHHSLPFDNQQASKDMTERSLPSEYAETLVTGIWPCTAILPDIETGQSGKPLRLGPVSI